MTSRKVTARILWRAEAEGGRATMPSGSRYVTVASFDPPTPSWPQEAWSVVVEPLWPAHFTRDGAFSLRFVVDGAPHTALKAGVRFELLEGNRVVADGEVVDEREP
jgi:hypothetical protein